MMKFWSVLSILLMVSLTAVQAQEKYRPIAAKKLHHKIDSSIQLVDVRSTKEFTDKHLKNSINLDVNLDSFKSKLDTLQKNQPVYLYCRSGKRSEKAAQILIDNGFKEVYYLKGGLLKWEKKRLEILPGQP